MDFWHHRQPTTLSPIQKQDLRTTDSNMLTEVEIQSMMHYESGSLLPELCLGLTERD